MNKSINISVSSGTVAIGAVAQGNGSQVNVSQVQSTIISNETEKLLQRLQALAATNPANATDLGVVNTKARELADATKSGDVGKGAGALKTIRDNFSWAYPAVKDFALAVWPAILAAIES